MTVATEILLPQFGMGMTDATVVRWLKAEGDSIDEGEVLCEVETAKATAEVTAPASGVLTRILIADSEVAQAREPIGIIEAAAGDSRTTQVRDDRRVTDERDTVADVETRERGRELQVQIEPRARRAAETLGIDLRAMRGSGPNGRITASDVERAVASGTNAGIHAEALRAVVSKEPDTSCPAPPKEIPHTRMRREIAARVTEAKRTVPHFYLTAHCNIDKLQELRQHAAALRSASGPTVNDFVVKAIAMALRQVPAANVRWTESALLQYQTVDVSVAIATASGLVTPVVKNADTKSVYEISDEVKSLAARARDGRLPLELLEGGQITVSNLGMYGASEFTAIINPPQACILAVGAAELRPVVQGQQVSAATLVTCKLSVDHRAIDGVVAAGLLAAFRSHLELPPSIVS